MNKRHYEHTLPNIRGSLSNTYSEKDYIRLSEEYKSEFTKTSKTGHESKL